MTSHIAVMVDVLPKVRQTQPTDRKMEVDGNARGKLTKFNYFSGTRKRRCHYVKVTSQMVNLSLEILFGMLPLKQQIHEPSAIRG